MNMAVINDAGQTGEHSLVSQAEDMQMRLMDSEEYAGDPAIPQIADDAAGIIQKLCDEIGRLKGAVGAKELWHVFMPVLSTGMISKATNDLLVENGDLLPWGTIASYDHGFFVSVPSEPEPDYQTYYGNPPPDDLVRLWAWAREKDLHWLRIDADGCYLENFPIYEW